MVTEFISREAAISEILSEPTDAHYPSWYAEKLKQIPTAKVDELSDRACFVDFMAKEDCYNPFESYGMVCVGCGCCSKNLLERAKARLALHERLLDHDNHFDLWSNDPELRAIQEGNVARSIAWDTERIAVYKAIISELEGGGEDG